MTEKKVTVMVIKVDLGCEKCRKKIKKVLCKIPQIQNQVYDEKSNTVAITVACCCPEKVKDKICCKAGDIILGIQIVEPPPPKVPEKPKEKPKEPEKPKPPEKPKEPEKPAPVPPVPQKTPEPAPKPPEPEKLPSVPPVIKPAPQKTPKPPEPVLVFPPPAYPQPRTCCRECAEGYGWSPCYRDPCRPPPCYDPCYGRPVYDSWGGGCRTVYVSRCSDYVSEENPNAACVIM